ncbi:MAG: hypothetical protein LBM25_06265 [Bacteroidales bacterium]|nr:hypothetical protein [Bacteroidales bacterium]
MSKLVSAVQEISDSVSKKITYKLDSTNRKSLAEGKGNKAICYYFWKFDKVFGKVLYVASKEYYYIVNVWTHPSYNKKFETLIDDIIYSFDLNDR